MTLVRRNSNPSFLTRSLLHDFFGNDIINKEVNHLSNGNAYLPKANILENDDAYMIELAVPGFDKKEFKIELNNEILSISADKEDDLQNAGNHRILRQEFSHPNFQRTFHLSNKIVDEAGIKAEYKSGVLRIFIPKREEAKPIPPRTIKVK